MTEAPIRREAPSAPVTLLGYHLALRETPIP
jgi:hypothetical protein